MVDNGWGPNRITYGAISLREDIFQLLTLEMKFFKSQLLLLTRPFSQVERSDSNQ